MTNANFSILNMNGLRACWTVVLRDWRPLAAVAIGRLKALAPYALIEVLLPGGSVMALLLWLYRRHKSRVSFGFPADLLASLQ